MIAVLVTWAAAYLLFLAVLAGLGCQCPCCQEPSEHLIRDPIRTLRKKKDNQ